MRTAEGSIQIRFLAGGDFDGDGLDDVLVKRETLADSPEAAVFVLSRDGPDGPLRCRELAVDISLQGPDIYYPPHAHRAVEIYAIIGGTGDWKRGLEPWTSRPPGDLILHPSGIRHAMQSNAEPLLALGFWTTDLESPIVIVRG